MANDIDLGTSIVRFNQSEQSISMVWTNESAPLCSLLVTDRET